MPKAYHCRIGLLSCTVRRSCPTGVCAGRAVPVVDPPLGRRSAGVELLSLALITLSNSTITIPVTNVGLSNFLDKSPCSHLTTYQLANDLTSDRQRYKVQIVLYDARCGSLDASEISEGKNATTKSRWV